MAADWLYGKTETKKTPEGETSFYKPGLMDYGSMIGQLGGTILSGYGSYQQAQQLQRQYELAVKAWEAEQERQRREEEERQRQQLLVNLYSGTNLGQGIIREAADDYGTYARTYGL